MSLRQSNNPYGYRELLVYKKAEQLQLVCAELTSHFPRSAPFTLSALSDQMDRSARSVKQNIVEGWKRNSTKEYYDFLGFSMGANAELEEDCDDIIKGIYVELKGLAKGMEMAEVERVKFYPLDSNLPEIVQLKLRCKELNMLLTNLQDSLNDKMQTEGTLSAKDKYATRLKSEKRQDELLDQMLHASGSIRLPNGQIVPKGERG